MYNLPTGRRKGKKLNIDFEPFKPINTVSILPPRGVIPANIDMRHFAVTIGALFGTLVGNTRDIIHKVRCAVHVLVKLI
jgi:hypothetical protein